MSERSIHGKIQNHDIKINIIIVSTITLASAILCFSFDLFEKIIGFSRYWEEYELDELIPTLFVFSIAMACSAVHRSRMLATTIKKYDQAEKALNKSENRLQALFENMGSGAVVFESLDNGNDFIFKGFNPAAEKIINISRKNTLNNHLLDLFPSLRKSDFVKALSRVWQTGKNEHLAPFYHKGKKVVAWVETRIFKLPTGEIVTIFDDVTEQHQAMEDLQNSEEKYRSMMEAMDDPAYICSSDFHIQYMNPAMIKKSGANAFEEYCYKIIYGLDEHCPWCAHEQVMQGMPVKKDVNDFKTDKSYHISNSPIFHADGKISLLAVLRDTSNIKKMEARFQQTQKMETIGILAGGIAHDFNNILFPILGYTEMLLADLPKESPSRNDLNGIYKGALRARDLVNQILLFARQEKSRSIPIKIAPVIKEALKLIRSAIPASIEIKQNIINPSGLIKADPTQIHQIIMNLATNAFHAMEEKGGQLKVSMKEVQLGRYDLIDPDMKPGLFACITVRDTGKGMDKFLTQKIFDPFFTTKKKGRGTGMGLSVVYGIVQSMGGTINAYSEPGKGTVFNVYLPVITDSFEQPEQVANEVIPGGTEHILLVDDEEAILKMEKQMLERMGYHVTSRVSSLEALEAFGDDPDKFDLIISDMAMPQMSGNKLVKELRKIRPNIPILLCTGFSEKIPEKLAAEIGIKDILLKPVIMKDLSIMIRKVLDAESSG